MIGAALYFFQEKFLFRPTKLAQDHIYELKYEFDEYFLNAEYQAKINTLHIKAENPKGAIIYFHGNAGSLERWSKIVEYLVLQDYDVYIMDYRTYGKSSGKLNEQVLYNDANMCYQHLTQFWDEKHIVVYGRSLGTAFASKVASENNPRQLILEAPFYSILDVAKYRFPIFPVTNLLKYELPNFKHLQNVKCPISIIHGTKDKIVPFSSGEKLFASSPKKNSSFIAIENGTHNNLAEFDDYHRLIKEILH